MNAMMKQQKSQDDSMDTDSNSDDNKPDWVKNTNSAFQLYCATKHCYENGMEDNDTVIHIDPDQLKKYKKEHKKKVKKPYNWNSSDLFCLGSKA